MNRLVSGQPGARRFYFGPVLEVWSIQSCRGCPDRLRRNPLVQSDTRSRTARAGRPARLWASWISPVRRCIWGHGPFWAWKLAALDHEHGLSQANFPNRVATESTMPCQNLTDGAVLVLIRPSSS